MKRKNVNKLLASVLTVSMAAGMVGCGSEAPAPADAPAAETPAAETPAAETPAENDAWTPLTDADGNVYDLGGMEIVIRDWWSSGDPAEATNAYEEARQEWYDFIQETYNFKIKQMNVDDTGWGDVPQKFVDYASAPDDGNNYIFVLRSDGSIVNAMYNGLMKDLSKLDCLDFSDPKWKGGVDELFSIGDSKYCMYAQDPEPRCGVYFNKRLLQEAGINPDDLYKWQAEGTWTFEKCEEVLKTVQRDVDNDGVIDIWGTTNNTGNVYKAAAFCNGGSFVKKGADGKFVYSLEDEETITGLNWADNIIKTYQYPQPEDANWDAYITTFQNGDAALCFDDAYMAGQQYNRDNMEDDFGFVCFPKGPNATEYTNVWSNNPFCIPGNYDDEKAWKIAFAFNLYTSPIPGFEDYVGWKSGYYDNFRDMESVDETLQIMTDQGCVNLADVIPNLDQGSEFLWGLGGDTLPAAKAEETRVIWQEYVNAANNK